MISNTLTGNSLNTKCLEKLPLCLEIWKNLEFYKYLNTLKLKYRRSSVFIKKIYLTKFFLNNFILLQLMINCTLVYK